MGGVTLKKKKKGVTLLELIIVLALSAIVSAVAFLFYSTNNRNVRETEIRSDLQREGEQIVSKITRSLMEAKNISEIKAPDSNADGNPEDAIEKTSCDLKSININLLSGSKEYLIDGKKFMEGSSVLGENVKVVSLKTIDDETFETCKGIKITLKLTKKFIAKDIDYEITSNIIFRNNVNSTL